MRRTAPLSRNAGQSGELAPHAAPFVPSSSQSGWRGRVCGRLERPRPRLRWILCRQTDPRVVSHGRNRGSRVETGGREETRLCSRDHSVTVNVRHLLRETAYLPVVCISGWDMEDYPIPPELEFKRPTPARPQSISGTPGRGAPPPAYGNHEPPSTARSMARRESGSAS